MPSRKSKPGPHPEPPKDLARRRLPVKILDIPWYRIHRHQFDPLYFGNSGGNRFDAPTAEYGVLYVGRDIYCAFIETFGHQTGVRLVLMEELLNRGLARIEVSRPLRLVDLTADGPPLRGR